VLLQVNHPLHYLLLILSPWAKRQQPMLTLLTMGMNSFRLNWKKQNQYLYLENLALV
jgi:hypothetical protein